MLSTELTRRFGIEHPIISAGMARWAGATLAAAVSKAGALGTIGTIAASPRAVREEIAQLRAATDRPFSANLVCFDWAPFASQMLDVVIEERVPVVTLSFGTPLAWVEPVKAAGLKVIVQVQDLETARAAIAARPDAIIVQGTEAGGHTGRRGTLNFAAQMLDEAGEIPVIVAGGIATGRGLAAALAMGAAGVVMGTRFKATPEFNADDDVKAQIVASDGGNTFYGEVVDLVRGGRWPNGVTGRVLQSRFTAEWGSKPDALVEAVKSQPDQFGEAMENDPERRLNWAGESSGLVHELLPAGEIVRRVSAEAEALLKSAATVLTPEGATASR
ncbi:MAG TPA: nitronate monooxygenase [Tepidiformaceae bacterium]|nr:nitronate monooxygenase [Tepidiformaceae bacterium]